MAPGDPGRIRLREQIIERYLPLSAHLARRYRSRGEPLEDLTQVAALGLIKAVDGYDPGRGGQFASYAIPTILGELRRHFRDRAWSVRPPRRLQELKRQIAIAAEDLNQQLHRPPTTVELAANLHTTEQDIIAGLRCADAYQSLSIDNPALNGGYLTLINTLGRPDPAIDEIDNREELRPLLAKLPARDQSILAMRFHRNLSQAQIAAEIGVSQMHVSRLLARCLSQLRNGLLATR